jgi:hypothetical protein
LLAEIEGFGCYRAQSRCLARWLPQAAAGEAGGAVRVSMGRNQ